LRHAAAADLQAQNRLQAQGVRRCEKLERGSGRYG